MSNRIAKLGNQEAQICMALIKSIYWEQVDADTLVYLFPFKDITTGSVLTVNDSQEAYFYKNGTLYDKFESGRHVLSTSNLPLLNKIINIPSGGESTFKANVWYVSKLEKRNLLWGAGWCTYYRSVFPSAC